MPFDYMGGGVFTPEERAYLMQNMPNIGQQEDELERQQMLANALMVRAPQQRMDWASQAARGLQGIGSGIMNYQLGARQKALGEQMGTFARGWPGGDGMQDMLERYRKYSQVAPMGAYGDV